MQFYVTPNSLTEHSMKRTFNESLTSMEIPDNRIYQEFVIIKIFNTVNISYFMLRLL
jgi:hypothetical protein